MRLAGRTLLNVYEILEAADRHAVNGVLYNGDPILDRLANTVVGGINDAGGIY
jgi:hypothetical protein